MGGKCNNCGRPSPYGLCLDCRTKADELYRKTGGRIESTCAFGEVDAKLSQNYWDMILKNR